MVLVFHGVCLLWVLFRAPDLSTAIAYGRRLLLPPYTASDVPPILAQWLIGFALLHPFLDRLIRDRGFLRLPVPAQVASCGLPS